MNVPVEITVDLVVANARFDMINRKSVANRTLPRSFPDPSRPMILIFLRY